MIKAGILGATGYAGQELVRILYHHPEVEIKVLSSNKHNNQVYNSIYGNFNKICEMKCEENELENIANSFSGVDKCYAIQAGREIRILVENEKISDTEAVMLCKDIIQKVEAELTYPGQIKVTVIREMRVSDFAK